MEMGRGYDENELYFMSHEESERRESVARGETYRILGDMIVEVDAIRELKERLEPIFKPIELYENEGDSYKASYFGSGAEGGKSGERVLSVNLGVSSSHNLNAVISFYDRTTLSFSDGNTMEISYFSKNRKSDFGLQVKGKDSIAFIASANF